MRPKKLANLVPEDIASIGAQHYRKMEKNGLKISHSRNLRYPGKKNKKRS
jgi:hypothetical protein